MNRGLRTPLFPASYPSRFAPTVVQVLRRRRTLLVIASFVLCCLTQATSAWGATVSIAANPASTVNEAGASTTTASFDVTLVGAQALETYTVDFRTSNIP